MNKKRISGDLLQFIKFGIVGISNTLISYILNIGTILILYSAKVNWDIYAGNVVAFILSVLWSFYWNSKYVFKSENCENRVWWKSLLKTYVSYAVSGLVLANILSWLWVDMLDISKFIAPLINLIITVPINFALNKYWAFQ